MHGVRPDRRPCAARAGHLARKLGPARAGVRGTSIAFNAMTERSRRREPTRIFHRIRRFTMTGEATWLTGLFLAFGAFGILVLAIVAQRIGMMVRAARRDVVCPATERIAHCVVLTDVNDGHPVNIASCSRFDDPERVTCRKRCLSNVPDVPA
jgi:hypothetical protein